MKVNEFIKKVEQLTNVQIIKKILEVEEYMPFSEKKELAQNIIERSIVRENGFVRINEIDKYLIFTTEVIAAFTNLEFSGDLAIRSQEYDMLVQSGRLSEIIEMLGADYKTILELVKMESDFVSQENSVEYQTAKFFDGLNKAVYGLSNTLSSQVEKFNISNLGISPEQISQLGAFLSKYNK